MKTYTMDAVTMDMDFTPGYGNVVPFQIDGQKRQLIRGNLEIKADGKVIIKLAASDAVMTLEQTESGWKITESLLPTKAPGIHIGGQVSGQNVNIGGNQVIGDPETRFWRKDES